MTVKAHRTGGRRAVLVLLCLLAMGNVSDGMVVCVAGQGHVAIESAGHDHCAGAEVHGDVATRSVLYLCGHAANGSCIPCVDIPLSLGAFDHRFASAVLKANASAPAVCIEPSTTPQDFAATLQTFTPGTLLTYHAPLTSVILQV